MLAVVLCLLLLSLIISVTICCVFRKKKAEAWEMHAPNGSYSDRNVAALGEGTENGGVSLQEVVEEEGEESPDFDFDAMADDMEMKVSAHLPSSTHQTVRERCSLDKREY